jgi:hypothetical protein
MKTLPAFILVMLYFFTLSRLSAQGYLMLSGGSGEAEGGWSDLPYSKVVEYAANKKIAVISYSYESAWIPDILKVGGRFMREILYPRLSDSQQPDSLRLTDHLRRHFSERR